MVQAKGSSLKGLEDDMINSLSERLGNARLSPGLNDHLEFDTQPEAEALQDPVSSPEHSPLRSSAHPDCVPFDPTGHEKEAEIRESFENNPRYLYHVFDNKTSGETCAKWVKSKDVIDYEAGNYNIEPYEDFFKWDRRKAAKTLNDHLRWWPMTQGKNHLHSWTSSLTFALTYAIYRTKSVDLETPLDEISLCVVDTTRFPRGVFIRDMDLIEDFCNDVPVDEKIPIYYKKRKELGKWENWGLSYMKNLRNSTGSSLHYKDLKASFYFGEYLSQGWLDLEGPELADASIIIPCDKIINDNLYKLDPNWKEEFNLTYPEWAKPTLRLRKSFYETSSPAPPTTQVEIKAVMEITENVGNQHGGRWRLVIAANLFALRARRDDEEWALQALYEGISGLGAEASCLRNLGGTPDEKLPEVRQFHRVARGIIELRSSQAWEKFCTESKEITDSAQERAKSSSLDEKCEQEAGAEISAALSKYTELIRTIRSEFSDVIDPGT